MAVDLFRLGITAILLGLLFPLVEFVGKYVGTGTAIATLLAWVIGILLILASAFTEKEERGRSS